MRGCLTEKIAGKNRRTLSHERFASERWEFSPNGSQSRYSASGRASSGQGEASVAVRAREIGYCGIASGVADRGFATPCFQAPPATMRTPPSFFDPPAAFTPPRPSMRTSLDFWTPPAAFRHPPGHQCGPPSDFWDPPSQRMITPPRTRSSSARARSDADKGAFDLPRVGAGKIGASSRATTPSSPVARALARQSMRASVTAP